MKVLKILLLFFVVFLILLSVFLFLNSAVTHSFKSIKHYELNVVQGMSSSTIAQILEDKKIIRSAFVFKILSKLTGRSRKLQAGLYSLSSTNTCYGILKKLSKGKISTISFTIPEGFTLLDIDNRLSNMGILKSGEFKKAARNKKILNYYNISYPTAEGYLYPDTYTIKKETTDAFFIVKMMIDRFFIRINDRYINYIKQKNISFDVFLRVASLVEAEDKIFLEKPLIAAVYFNRLDRGMKLESCPTVIYALGYHKNKLLFKDLKINSPYNTYIHHGLPPTPICSPSEETILATMFPADVDYIFMVARGDGTHYFSSTYKRHMEAYRYYVEKKPIKFNDEQRF